MRPIQVSPSWLRNDFETAYGFQHPKYPGHREQPDNEHQADREHDHHERERSSAPEDCGLRLECKPLLLCR